MPGSPAGRAAAVHCSSPLPEPAVTRPPARTRAQPARPSPQQCELPGAEPSGEARAPALGRAFPELTRGVRGRERRRGPLGDQGSG